MRPSGVSFFNWLHYNLLFFAQHWLGYERYVAAFSGSIRRLNQRISSGFSRQQVKREAAFIREADANSTGGNKPLLFRGAASGWPGTQQWSLDFFAEKYGDRVIEINSSKGLTDPNSPQVFEELLLKDYIEQIRQGTLKYLKLSGLVQQEKSLQDDLDQAWLKRFKKGTSFGELFYSFIGGKGSVTPLHNEFNCTLYVQISGQKKWILYHPGDRIFLDAITERRPYFFSNATPDNTDNPALPLQKHATKYEVILNPGDALWVPPFVWHYVENMTDSIGVAYKFADIPAAWRSTRMLTFLFFLSTRPSIVYSFFASRLKKEDYVLSKKHSK